MAKKQTQRQQPPKRRKKTRATARFYTIIATFLIIVFTTIFLFFSGNNQIPNLHGWQSVDVIRFADDNDIEIEFEFIYSSEIAPTLVISQSVAPGTNINEVSRLTIQISKGIEVR